LVAVFKLAVAADGFEIAVGHLGEGLRVGVAAGAFAY
jgi:hypothetical protein